VILDAHVHLVGDGSDGSGCWYRPQAAGRLLAPVFGRALGLTRADLRDHLDRAYRARLLEFRRASSLDAIALFAQDAVYRDDGSRWEGRGTFYVPNDAVLELARREPGVLPVVSIHPARADALDELARCIAAGAAALKLLPNCHNVDCALPRYRRFWEALAAHGLPLIAHTGAEGVVDEVRRDLADPRNLLPPLAAGVTVIAAHCGIGTGIVSPDYFPVFRRMLAAHPNLYGDTSALALPVRVHRLRATLQPGVVERLVHGSDVPVPVMPHAGLLAGLLGVGAWWRLRRIRNPLERDYRFKRALGYPDAVFSRGARLLRRPAAPPPPADPQEPRPPAAARG
jgi:uncharacterized protein